MTLYNLDSVEPAPSAAHTLTALSDAMRGHGVSSERRVLATKDSRATAEGLALLKSYVAIQDRGVRQAILDAVLALAETELRR